MMPHSDALPIVTLAREEAAVIPVEHIRVNSVTDFPIFLSKDGSFVLFSHEGHRWQPEEIELLLKDGHGVLFYHTADSSKLDLYLKISSLPSVDPKLPPALRVINITDVGAELTRLLYNAPMTKMALAKGEEVANHMVTCLLEDRTCVAALGKLANHHWYTYYHSARVAAYSISIALELGLINRDQLEMIAVGCLFHDIGKSKINIDVLNKSGPLTSEEWGLIRKHPEFGSEVVEQSSLQEIPRQIILHHHERLDGSGYPHNLSASELLKEVRIAAFADTFDALTTNRSYQSSRSRFEALDLIRHKFLEQLDRDCYRAMIMIFNRAAGVKT
jgi:putative nucleotidyltransferase with HDIG domain